MKLLNYDARTLILENLREVEREKPTEFTVSQYRILCNLIKQKHITKKFFDFLLVELFELKDWRKMNYEQMYQMIHILTYWNYEKRGK